jgi:bromodomain-containing factor 1
MHHLSHTSPQDTKPSSDTQPTVNGNGKRENPDDEVVQPSPLKDRDASNPVSVESKRELTAASESVSKDTDAASNVTLEESKTVDEKASKDTTDDVDMVDATNGDDAGTPAAKEVDGKPADATKAAADTVLLEDDIRMSTEEPTPPATKEKVNGTDQQSLAVEKPEATAPAAEDDSQPAGLSQLAIDTDGEQPSPTTKASDLVMSDAPINASNKMSREREEDPGDEPAPKRAKTETQDEIVIQSQGPKGPSALESLTKWTDSTHDDESLTPFRAREYRRVLAGVKKTKNGGLFKDSVEKLWPSLWDTYITKVDSPMDIGELERRLRVDGSYKNVGAFRQDLGLLYKNALAFNGDGHEVTHGAYAVVEKVWTSVVSTPAEEPPKSKPPPKQLPTRQTEPRVTAQPPPRRQSSVIAASPVEKPADAPTYAVPPSGVPQVRRASTQNDLDRPKRAIHPPKNKDIDYAPKNLKKKKLQPDLRFCETVLTELTSAKNQLINIPFLQPVDPVALSIPDYFKIIKKPMDLGTMGEKLATGNYQTAKEFENDMNQVFKNCFKFNPVGSPVHDQGREMEALFKTLWAGKAEYLAKHTPGKAQSLDSSSSRSDDSEEEEEEAAPAPDVQTSNATILALQTKMQEETAKLNELYMAAEPNEALINLQQSVLSTVQNSLLQEKQKLATQKPEKPAKAKPAKASKAKNTGGGGGAASKKAASQPATKKGGASGGAPKKSKKRALLPGDKEMIASAIGDLDSPEIDQAVDIIKKDTGQAVSNGLTLNIL